MSPLSLRVTAFVCAGLRKSVVVMTATLSMLLVCLPLFSQAEFGRIVGTVTDQTGGVMAGATVTVTDTQRGIARNLTTDNAGEYLATTLSPGTYTVQAEAKGFRTVQRQNIVLEVGKDVRIDLSLQPGEQTQTVTVTESIPLVDTTSATLGGTVNNQTINDLPLNGRNYQNLMALRPGVAIYPGGGPWTQSTNNIRPDEDVYMVDGVLNSNFFDARPVANMPSPFTDGATILPIDAIQEFNLMENPKAESGWKPGAVVNVGIKSGTNTLHGSAYAFGRDGSWDARNYFNPAPTPQLPTQLEQFGGTVGGPIKKDKLFFFAGYEGLRSLIGGAFAGQVPETAGQSPADPQTSLVDAIKAVQAAGLTPSPVSLKMVGCTAGPTPACTGGLYQGAQPNTTAFLSNLPNNNTSDNGIAKIDYHVNSKHTINGMLFIGNYLGSGEDHPFVNTAFADTSFIRTWSNVENWIWTPNSNVVNEARFGYDRVTFTFNNNDINKLANGIDYPLNTGVTNPGGLPNININGFLYMGTNQNRPQHSSPNPFLDFQDSVSYLKGKHAFKFGGEVAHIEADSTIYASGRGQIYFQGGSIPTLTDCNGASCPLEDFIAGVPSKGQLLAGNPDLKVTWMSYSGYAQDDWRFTPKFTLNLGLRYEYESPMKEASGLLGSFDPNLGMVQQGQGGLNSLWKPDRNNFSPRFGFAWDITGKGTTVVRGGASLIYSSFVLYTYTAEFSFQNTPSSSIASIPTGATLFVNGVQTPGNPNGIKLFSDTFSGSQLNWNGVVFPTPTAQCGDGVGTDPGPCNLLGVDPNLRTPYVTNWNLGIQHSFGSNLSLDLSYVGNHGSSLLGFRDINAIDPTTGVRPFGAKFPYLQYINWAANDAHSNYNSLQATLTKRVSRGLSFVGGYTYAHGLDNGSLNRFGLLPQDSRNPQLEYSNSDFDIRHRFTLTTTYNLPGKKGFGQLLEGWQVNSIVSLETGQPWTISDSTNNFSGNGDNTDRWDFFGNPNDFKSGPVTIPFCGGFIDAGGTINSSAVTCSQTSQFGTVNLPASMAAPCAAKAPSAATLATAGCFVVGNSVMVPPPAGTFGTMGRNIFRDTGFKNWDLSFFKNFAFKERFGAQFRAEFFNILNHPAFANPYGSANGYLGGIDPSAPSGFGYAGSTPDFAAGNPIIGSGSNRVIQLGLKLTF